VSAVRLSVCVPVYNFAAWFGATVESIARQAPDGVEILIVDGASTDDTPAVAAALTARYPRVRYHRLERRGGIDGDIARSVELARGDYCWVFGGDDLMRDGTLAAVLTELEGGHDVYLVEAMLCDVRMKPLGLHRMLNMAEPRVFRLDDRSERLDYFRRARNTAAFFSFCSSVVVRRDRWMTTDVDEVFMTSCWGIAARIFAMLPGGLSVKYLADPLLDKRTGNDSFLTSGLVRRFGISVDGYHAIADRYFEHRSEEAFHVRRAVRAELPWLDWLFAKREIALAGRRDDYAVFNKLVRKNFADASARNWAAYLACRFTPAAILSPLKRLLDLYRAARAR
jgi:O-antigen biosynthesis alpha-1,3-abequosyltransferase